MNETGIFSSPQVIENSSQYLLLQTEILQKTIVGRPVKLPFRIVYDETAQLSVKFTVIVKHKHKHKNSLTTLDNLINRSVMASFISYTLLKLII